MAGISSTSLFVLLLVFQVASPALGKTVKYYLDIEYGFASPDCVERQVVLINGKFVGPTLCATEGDRVKVWVTNHLSLGEGVAIHWHGISQRGSPWMDGVGYVSQCPIEGGETFLYEFTVNKAGTYSYHGHYGMHNTEGLYGQLIVLEKKNSPKPYKYDGEISMIISDWWHRPVKELATGLLSRAPFWRFPGEPQSLLIDGRGKYNCTPIPPGRSPAGDYVTCNASSPDCSRSVYTVEYGKTYRLRVSNTASLSHLNLIVEAHEQTIIEADAYYTKPVKVMSQDLHAGQGTSVLFTANQKPGNYWIGINVRSRRPGTPTGLAILNYKGVPVADPVTPPPVSPLWNDTAFSIAQFETIKALGVDSKPVPRKSDYQLVLLQQQKRSETVIKWSINNVSFVEPKTPFILGSYFGLKAPPPAPLDAPVYDYTMPPADADYTKLEASYYTVPFGKVVDITIQNANMLAPNTSDSHPWHMHGHHFWVVGSGKGKFDPAKDPANYNLVDPPRRYTSPVFRYGWTTFRFIADNPGFWNVHCHIVVHQFMGMGFVIAEGVDKIPPPPKDLQFCGELDLGYLSHKLKRHKKHPRA